MALAAKMKTKNAASETAKARLDAAEAEVRVLDFAWSMNELFVRCRHLSVTGLSLVCRTPQDSTSCDLNEKKPKIAGSDRDLCVRADENGKKSRLERMDSFESGTQS